MVMVPQTVNWRIPEIDAMSMAPFASTTRPEG